MSKFVAKFLADKSLQNANRLVTYVSRHMMAECYATAAEAAAIAEARAMVGK